MIRVTENLELISNLLVAAAEDAGREPDDICLLAVSKKQPVDKILAAADAGHRHFGENFVQEGLDKIGQCRGRDLIWHFIGHLQSNKTRSVAENFDWVHTIDKEKTARRLSDQRPASLPPLNVCLQVNIDDEDSKSGLSIAAAPDVAAACSKLDRIRLRGLMCLPRTRENIDAQREPFRRLRELQVALQAQGIALDTLSMGMSNDYVAAIQEGATIIRIGTALFGERV